MGGAALGCLVFGDGKEPLAVDVHAALGRRRVGDKAQPGESLV